MEDILASIKRIIAEDGEAAAPPPSRVRRGPVAVPDPEPEAPAEPAAARQSDPEPEPPLSPADHAPGIAEADGPAPDHGDVLELTSPMVAPQGWHAASILSTHAEQASRHAFAALQQARPEEPAAAPADARTIEGFMADMLRPMLSEWLDAKLPAIVERIVTDEVRRISGRG